MRQHITLHHLIYPADCVRNAIATYESLCKVTIVERQPDRTLVQIQAQVDINESNAAGEFLNYLLDMSVESHFRES
jgi:hypothetical protein